MKNLCQFSLGLLLQSLCLRTAQTRLSLSILKNKSVKSWSFKGVNRGRCDVLKSKYFTDCWTGTKSWSEKMCERRFERKYGNIFRLFFFNISTFHIKRKYNKYSSGAFDSISSKGSEALLFIIYVQNLTLTQ